MDERILAALRIRIRHLRRDLDWLLWAAGASTDDAKSFLGAWYLAYVAAVGVAWSVSSWAALEHAAAELLGSLPAAFALAPLGLAMGAWCAAAFVCALQALRRSPFRLLAADISWLSGSGPALVAMAASDVVLRCAGACALGVLAGLLATSGMASGLRIWAAALSALAGLCTVLLPCVIAEARLVREKTDAFPAGALLLAIAAACAMAASAALLRVPGVSETVLFALALSLAASFAILERNVCMPALACEALSDTEPLTMRWLRLTNLGLHRELARSARLRRRGALIELPLGGCGWKALVSRAALVHLRRFECLVDILLFAGVYVPLLGALCSGVLGRGLLLPGAALLLWNYHTARELVRVFNADEDNRLIRPFLPFGTLRLLVADSLPALLLAILASCLACVVALGHRGLAPQTCAICVLLDIATVICGGISRIVLPGLYRRVSFELAFLAVVVVTCLVSLTGEWLAVAAVLAAFVLIGGAMVFLGRDAPL